MRKRVRRCPEVEALDSRMLLSGTAAAQPVAAFSSLQITGTVHGTTSDRGDPRFHLSGVLSPLGNVKDAGHGSIATVTSTNGSFSLSNKLGTLWLATDVVATGKRSFSGAYQILGGTQAYAGDSGVGAFVVSDSGNTFVASFN
jgi:hypothetical protein